MTQVNTKSSSQTEVWSFWPSKQSLTARNKQIITDVGLVLCLSVVVFCAVVVILD